MGKPVKLTATINGFYVKQGTGTKMFRYLVNGDKESLKAYEDAQGSNFRPYDNPQDQNDPLNGTPLYFSSRPLGKTIELDITNNDKVVVKQDVMAVMEEELVQQDRVNEHLAKFKAEQIFRRQSLGNRQPVEAAK